MPNKKKIHQIKDQPKIKEQQNKSHPRHHNNNKKIRDQREQADRRWDLPKGGSTQSKQIGDSAGRSRVWRMGLTNGVTISGFAMIGGEWVWRFLGSRRSMMNGFDNFWVRDLRNGFDSAIFLSLSLSLCLRVWVLPSLALSLSLGIARRMSSVLGFLGSSELLDVDRSCLRRCWGAGAISLPCCLSLSLLFSWGRSDLKWKWERKLFFALSTLFYCQTKNIFSLIEFSVTAKHPLFQKSISGISLKPKQTEPKSQVICKLRILVRSQ